jgi:hypothetical protein
MAKQSCKTVILHIRENVFWLAFCGIFYARFFPNIFLRKIKNTNSNFVRTRLCCPLPTVMPTTTLGTRLCCPLLCPQQPWVRGCVTHCYAQQQPWVRGCVAHCYAGKEVAGSKVMHLNYQEQRRHESFIGMA